jgi:hypothetical protein
MLFLEHLRDIIPRFQAYSRCHTHESFIDAQRKMITDARQQHQRDREHHVQKSKKAVNDLMDSVRIYIEVMMQRFA